MHKIFFLAIPFLGSVSAKAQEVFCAVPVAEGVGVRLALNAQTEQEARACYRTIATCSAVNCKECPRKCQTLLHQKLILIDEQGYEVLVEVPDMNKKQCWMLKENIFKRSYGNNNSSFIVLTLLLSDPVTGLAFSAGTRFLIDRVMPQGYQVAVYNKVARAFDYTFIPSTHCITEKERNNFTTEQKKQFFMQLIKDWANFPERFFSCVSGGCSIAKGYKDNEYYLVKNGWERPRCNCDMPYTGVDISGLIWLAAHIAGIPHNYKNIDDIKNSLNNAVNRDSLQDGDLIWIKDSILFVSDSKKNKAITVMSYESGYGMLLELPLSKIFQGIKTYDDLYNTHDNAAPLQMLNKDGTLGALISDFQFLKLSSVFN